MYDLTILGGESVVSNSVVKTLSSHLLPPFKLSDLDNKIAAKAKELGFVNLGEVYIYNTDIFISLSDYRDSETELLDSIVFVNLNADNQGIYEKLLEYIFPGNSSLIINKMKNVAKNTDLEETLNVNGKEILIYSYSDSELGGNVVAIGIKK